MGIVDHESTIRVDFNIDVVFSAATEKFRKSDGFKLLKADRVLHTIDLNAGMSLFSWGENITITFREIDTNKTEISILSTPKTGVLFGGTTDMGKNRKNIKNIMELISSALRGKEKMVKKASALKLSPLPKEFLFQCPHCGQSLECSPELENTVCACPACQRNVNPHR